jgi:hypothetical protein
MHCSAALLLLAALLHCAALLCWPHAGCVGKDLLQMAQLAYLKRGRTIGE